MKALNNKRIRMLTCILLAYSMLCLTITPLFARAELTAALVQPAEELKLEDLLLASILANYFDVDLRFIITLRDEKHFDFLEIAMLLALAQAGNRKADSIVVLRAKGHGWGVIAHKLGVHPGLFNQVRKWFFWGKSRDYVVEDVIIIKMLSGYFSIPTMTIRRARAQGLSFEAIAIGLNVAAKSGKPAYEVFRLRTKGADWAHVAKEFNLNEEQLKKPPAPKHKFKVLLEQEKKGKSRGRGKGRI